MSGFTDTINHPWDEDHNSSSYDLVLSSPSKLNLFFRVLRKREDGFHEIASLFQAINLCDTLSLKHASEEKLTCSDPTLSCDESNLVIKALKLFQKKTNIFEPVHFHLTKQIPVQAGLGGGSGNAATALWALNELFERPVTEKELYLWSQEIGSDVPFFFSKGTSYCTGRGEILQDFSLNQTQKKILIAKPIEGLSTPAVFKTCKPALLPNQDPQKALESFKEGTGSYYNDLEVAAFDLLPSLKELKMSLLAAGFSHVVMTGSGTSFFCIGEKEAPSIENVRFFKAEFLQREEGSWYKLSPI